MKIVLDPVYNNFLSQTDKDTDPVNPKKIEEQKLYQTWKEALDKQEKNN